MGSSAWECDSDDSRRRLKETQELYEQVLNKNKADIVRNIVNIKKDIESFKIRNKQLLQENVSIRHLNTLILYFLAALTLIVFGVLMFLLKYINKPLEEKRAVPVVKGGV